MSGNERNTDFHGLGRLMRSFTAWDIRRMMLLGWIAAWCLVLSGNVFGQAVPGVSASVKPARVTVGEVVTYEVSVDFTGRGQPSVSVPVIDADTGLSTPSNARTRQEREQYITPQGYALVNKYVFLYNIRTSKAGKFEIPPATVTLNGQRTQTNSVELTVADLPQAREVPKELEGLVAPPLVSGNPELQRRLTGGIFILPVLAKNDPYNGEQVRVSFHLVIDPDALREARLQPRTNLDGVTVPSMNQFIKEELFPFPQDLSFKERKIGDRHYLVAPVYEAVIASTKSGELEIEPFHISMYFSQAGGSQRSQLPPGFANDPFFSNLAPLSSFGTNTIRVIAQSPVLKLNVKPLPAGGQPSNFGGAVGEFEVTAEVDKRQARAYDDTISLRVKVEGEGNAESISAPELPQMPGFTVLGRPTTRTGGQPTDDEYVSTKIFEYTLRPTQPGNTEIPPVQLPYFDPEGEEYKLAVSDRIAMEIAPGTRPVPTPVQVVEDEEDPDETAPEVDLRYVSADPLPAPGGGLGRIWGALGVVMFLMPPALAGASMAMAWVNNRRATQVVDSRKTFRSASNEHLREAGQALSSGDYTKMAAELAEGIRLHFAARLQLSVAEITIPAIEENLSQAGAPPDLVSGISRVLETCDSAQYGGGLGLNQGSARSLNKEALALLKRSEDFV